MGVTVHDVAREAGVSIATVSRAVRGLGVVSPELAERVQATAERLGYVPSRVGRALREQHANTWSVLVPELNAFIAQVVASVEGEAAETDTSVYLGITNYDPEHSRRLIEAALSQHSSGLILAGVLEAESLLRNVRVPVVLVDRFLDDARDCVVLDNPKAGRLAGEHVLQQGCSRPVCITGAESETPVKHRAEGFAGVLQKAGISFPQGAICETELTAQGGKDAMMALLKRYPRLDSVYCASGPLSLGAYFALQEFGARNVVFVANDDEDWMAMAVPPVTTVRQPVDLMGKTASDLLRARIENPDLSPQKVILEPTLVVRESSVRHTN